MGNACTSNPRIELGPPRDFERESLADISRHVRNDPDNFAWVGEYCGIIIGRKDGKFMAIRVGANSQGACGYSGRFFHEAVRPGEGKAVSAWHSHPPHVQGAPQGIGPGAVPPGGGDAEFAILYRQYVPSIVNQYVFTNTDPEIIYRFRFTGTPTHSYEAMVKRGLAAAIDSLAHHFVHQGHSSHSAWMLAQQHYSTPAKGRAGYGPNNANTDDLGTGLFIEISYDGGRNFGR